MVEIGYRGNWKTCGTINQLNPTATTDASVQAHTYRVDCGLVGTSVRLIDREIAVTNNNKADEDVVMVIAELTVYGFSVPGIHHNMTYLSSREFHTINHVTLKTNLARLLNNKI